jgi:Domain of unknown function (DU1801)
VAENKTRPTDVDVSDYLDSIPAAGRQADARAVCDMMSEITGLKPRMWGPSMIGFGDHHYVYESGREGDTFVIGLAARKAALSLYLTSLRPLDEDLLAALGKHRTGAGCLYVTRLSDVDLDVLRQLIRTATQPPA